MQLKWWIAHLLLLSPTLGVCAEEKSPIYVSTEDADSDRMQLGTNDVREFGDFIENATLSAAFSGCGLCQQTGQCDHAFRGRPGQFCLGMASGAPCCCPRDAQCAANPYECRCRRIVPTYHYDDDNYHSRSHRSGVSGTLIFFLLLLLFCVCCCYLPARRARQQREEEIVYAQPVATSQYGTYPNQQQPSYPYASGPMVYESSPYRESSGNSSMAAGALGALGGLGVGAALGSAFGGHNNGNNGNGYGGTMAGVTDDTYTFSGDTGDFSGDTGDYGGNDGTFAGDSY
ncbi:hypothetical protein Plhal703r1_c10g0052661 [Plasmopara halstedii]